MSHHRLIVAAVLCIAAGAASTVHAADITQRVLQESDLGQRIAKICQDHCQGNRREGRLVRMLASRTGPDTFAVHALVTLVNRHHQDPPKVMGRRVGGGVQVYSYTIDVEADGTLDDRSCNLRIDHISVRNDRLGLSQLARGQEGKTHRVADCERFVSDL